jgi:pimeloyl-ACP methyl ester carboxylesterase
MGTAIKVPVFEPRTRPRRHPVRIILISLVVLVLIVAAALIGVGWYYSIQLLEVDHSTSYGTSVLAAGPHSVTLSRSADTARPGTYGIEWPGGHAVIGQIAAVSGNRVTRALSASTGGLHAGMKVDLTASIYQTPADLKVPYQRVRFADPVGAMPAWYVPARGRVWVIVMHGYKSRQREGIRPMPVLHALGLPVLDIAYRNDVGAPYSPDHLYHLGATEWRDTQAAAKYALAHGAKSLVLMGYSLGGNIAEEFLHHSRYASRVRAVVLDSPAANWDAILDRQAADRNLPAFITWVGKRVIAYRMGLSSLRPVDTVADSGSVRTPTLLFYGTQDGLVPQSVFRSFIHHARPGTLTAVRIPKAGHTEPWNVQPQRYDTALRSFLTRVLGLKPVKHGKR